MSTHVARVLEILDGELVQLDQRRAEIQSTRETLARLFPPAASDEAPVAKPRKERAAKPVPVSPPQPRAEKQNRQAKTSPVANGSGTLAEKVAAVVYAAAGPVNAEDVLAELARLGVQSNVGSVGTTLGQLTKVGKIARASRGYYQAPGAAKADPPPASSSSRPTGKGKHAVEPWAGAYRCSNCFEERGRRTDYFKFNCAGGAE